MMLDDWPYECRLWALVTHGFAEAHLLAGTQILKLHVGDTIAMETDLAAIRRRDEPVVALGMQSSDFAVRWRLVLLDMPLALPGKILQLPSG